MANENAITKIQLKTKTSSDADNKKFYVKGTWEGEGITSPTCTLNDGNAISLTKDAAVEVETLTGGPYVKLTALTSGVTIKWAYAETTPSDPSDFYDWSVGDYAKEDTTLIKIPVYLSEIPLDQGEPLVDTNNNTVIIGTSSGYAANDDVIVLGNGHNVIADNDNNSITLKHYDGFVASPRSTHVISSDEHLLLDVDADTSTINLKHTKYTAQLMFGDYTETLTTSSTGKVITKYTCAVTGIKSGFPKHIIIPHKHVYNGIEYIVSAIAFDDASLELDGWDKVNQIDIPSGVVQFNANILSKMTSLKHLNLPKSLQALANFDNINNITFLSIPYAPLKDYVDEAVDWSGSSLKTLVISLNAGHICNLSDLKVPDNCIIKLRGIINLSKTVNEVINYLALPSANALKIIVDGELKAIAENSTADNLYGIWSNVSSIELSHKVRSLPANMHIRSTDISSKKIITIPSTVDKIGLNSLVPDREASDGSDISLTKADNKLILIQSAGTGFSNDAGKTYNYIACQMNFTSTSVSIPESVEYICTNAFANSKLTSITAHKKYIAKWPAGWNNGENSTTIKIIPVQSINGLEVSATDLSSSSKYCINLIDRDGSGDSNPSYQSGHLLQINARENGTTYVGGNGRTIIGAGDVLPLQYPSGSNYSYLYAEKGIKDICGVTTANNDSIYLAAEGSICAISIPGFNVDSTEDIPNTIIGHKAILLDTSGNSEFPGQVMAESFNARSDARLKENFQELHPEKSILDLPIYKFDFINGAKNQIGCKAQDLQEICPEIVDENSDGYLSIQESKIVYLLLQEIKTLKKRLESLERT